MSASTPPRVEGSAGDTPREGCTTFHAPGEPRLAELRAAVAAVLDPELPMVTIEDLGVLRDVRVSNGGRVEVDLTPTYSGCPAMGTIERDVEQALYDAGAREVAVRVVLSPAWTTEWISDRGRSKLTKAGIAPPGAAGGPRRTFVALTVGCPRCGARRTREVSRFGSTACKSLWWCEECREPFDHFKAH